MTEEDLQRMTERYSKYCQYYDRQGKQIDLLTWGRLFEDPEYKVVVYEEIGNYRISTVWMGHNMGFMYGLFHIFETMIFLKDVTIDDMSEWEGYQERYGTESEAREGHQQAIEYVNNLIKQAGKP